MNESNDSDPTNATNTSQGFIEEETKATFRTSGSSGQLAAADGQDIELQSLTNPTSREILATVPASAVDQVPLKITAQTIVDPNKLTPLE